MSRHRPTASSMLYVWVLALILGLVAVFSPAAPAEAQEENLASNPNFDFGFYTFAGISTVQPPVEWAPWWNNQADGCFNNQPNMNQAQGGNRVRSSPTAASVWISGGKTFEAGLVQVIDGLTPGNIYRFTIYGHAWQSADPANSGGVSDSDAIVDLKIGIDPTGLNAPFADTVVWSPVKNVLDQYEEFSVEATAQGSSIGIFTYGKPVGCATQTDTYWEDARVQTVGQGEVAPPPAEEQPAEESAPPPENNNDGGGSLSPSVGSVNVSEPDETGRQVHIVAANENLTIIALAYDTTITEIRALNDLSRGLRVGMELLIREGGGGSAAPAEEEAEGEEETAEEGDEEASDEEADSEDSEEEPEEEEEPEPVEEEVEVVTPARICIVHYEDLDANGTRSPDELLALGGVEFVLSDGNSVYERYTTDGISDSYCFGDVPAGQYIVAWTSEQYTAVSAQSQSAFVGSGETVTREFGAISGSSITEESSESGGLLAGLFGGNSDEQIDEAAPAPAGDAEESGGGIPTVVIAIVGAVGAIFVLSGLGAAAYFLLVRQTAGDEIE